MTQNLFQFIEVERMEPKKKEIFRRKGEFSEIYEPFQPSQVKMQADRCLSCGTPYCEWKCPVHNYIPDWLLLANQGKIIEAAQLCHQTNSLPEVCGRVCPQDRLCEGACTVNTGFGAVTIGSIEKYIVDTAFEMGWQPDLSDVPRLGRNVAIVGAGPAGLGCADVLVRNGVSPVVFDRHPEIGGLLTFGIPSFKLDKKIMQRRRQVFENMGIEFRLNQEVGNTILFETLLSDFEAVFVGIGAYQYLRGGFTEGSDQGVYEALPYLIANTDHLMKIRRSQYPYIDMKDKKVVVLGGGDTAMDCVRTAIRQRAAEVTCAYRRDRENMPGSAKEIINALDEGVKFEFTVQPERISIGKNGMTDGIQMIRTQLGDADERGRRKPEIIPGSETFLKADAVILAFGFRPDPPGWLGKNQVRLTSADKVDVCSENRLPFQTSNLKVFAGGDAVRGSDLVVTAIAEGRTAAQSILNFLGV